MSDTLAAAKAALAHAKAAFPESKPEHEFSHTPYKLAAAATKTQPNSGLSEANKEQESTGQGLKWNVEQAQAVKNK